MRAHDQSSIFSIGGKFCPDYGLLLELHSLTLVTCSYALLKQLSTRKLICRCKHAVIYVYLASLAMFYLLLHRTICNILLQFNVLRLANNVLINWCWLLLLLLASYCQRIALLAGRFLPHSIVVYHSTNQCSGDEWHSTGDNCCNNVAGGTWALHTVI